MALRANIGKDYQKHLRNFPLLISPGFGYSTDDLNIFDKINNENDVNDDADTSTTSYDVSPSTSKSLKMKIKRMKSGGFGGNHEIIRGPIEDAATSPDQFRRRQYDLSNDEPTSKRKKVSFHSLILCGLFSNSGANPIGEILSLKRLSDSILTFAKILKILLKCTSNMC
jgi:hypothetical protein